MIMGEEELERFLLAHHPEFLRILEEGERNIRETGGIPHVQFWAEVEQEVTERETMRKALAGGE